MKRTPKVLAKTNTNPTMPTNAPKLFKVSPIKMFSVLHHPCAAIFLVDQKGDHQGRGPLWVRNYSKIPLFKSYLRPGISPPANSIVVRCYKNGVETTAPIKETCGSTISQEPGWCKLQNYLKYRIPQSIQKLQFCYFRLVTGKNNLLFRLRFKRLPLHGLHT